MAACSIGPDSDFNYKALKTTFLSRLDYLLKTRCTTLWTLSTVRNTILKIKMYKRRLKPGKDSPAINIPNVELKIASYDGDQTLIFVKNEKVIEILPYEKCFDVFLDLHLRQSHAGFTKMYEVLQNYFYFSNFFLESFLATCNVCIENSNSLDNLRSARSYEEKKQNHFNKVVQITFLDMTSTSYSNNEFTHILVYKETASEYVLLRPLIALDSQEVASEIYAIFIDFGPPEILQTTHLDFLKTVLLVLKKTPIQYNCKIFKKLLTNDNPRYKILDCINVWIQHSGVYDWTIACYVLQFIMNTDKQNPMDKLFGRRIGQYAKISLTPVNETETTLRANENAKTENVKAALSLSLHTEVDLGILDQTKSDDSDEDESKPVSEPIEFIDCQSTEPTVEQDNPIKLEDIECYVCNRIIRFNFHTCNKCKEYIHIFCAHRHIIAKEQICEYEEFEVICTKCEPTMQLS